MSKPEQGLFKEIAFILYPVSDMARSRSFYEETLGLTQTANWQDQWVEYDIGPGTLALAVADEKHKPGLHGPTVGLEVKNWEATLAHLKTAGIPLVGEPFETPVCRGCFIRDPDGNELMLHAKKTPV